MSQKKWFNETQYVQLLSLCQLLPGPASSQLGFAIGLLRGGLTGGIAAFVGFTIPSIILLFVFAKSLSFLSSDIAVAAIKGLAILAFVVVLQAVIGMGKQLLSCALSWVLCLAMFLLVLNTQALQWQMFGILASAILSSALLPLFEASTQKQEHKQHRQSLQPFYDKSNTNISLGRISVAISATLFVGLLVLLPGFSGYFYPHADAFFTSGAMVFGGGHVVLPFLEQTTVAQGLLSHQQFYAGYGATQAVPGPMFSFAAYLGYVIELNQQTNGAVSPLNVQAISAGLMATLFLFLPGFLLVMIFLPVSQALINYQYMRNAFVGANAAVVGLLAATLYDPIFTHAINSNIDIAIAAVGFVALVRFKCPILLVVIFCVLAKILF